MTDRFLGQGLVAFRSVAFTIAQELSLDSHCTLQTTGSLGKSARAHEMVSAEDTLETQGNRSAIAKARST